MGWFRNKKIIPHKDVKKSWGTLHELAGLNSNSTIHTMRHDFCTQLLRQGVDVYTVQRLAGHADIRTTMKYIHYLEDEDFDNLNNAQYNYLQDPE
jgi:site-specific recombinase XerD